MKILDFLNMKRRLYTTLAIKKYGLRSVKVDKAISICAEGKSFPANLDTSPPTGGLLTETNSKLFRCVLKANILISKFEAKLSI
jgi:hypothetical protein